ncbi:UDP-3-O-(3-hydroxymyristoyl)glucosamine N-acyltransferase [Azospirillum brasilense]|uniref:UDP-3-O-acylglucosamine N-acyltransferase n=1 Tax=Azospirillum brasilense TaxID=192 RepID=A0A0P0EUT5_AZOBR|nr:MULTISPECIES: UDP-3-O-(3-hydroxymyristoyl)glucosamine N-acyltransferase [Azospirillum]ALJ36136.1 UDP-3-O-(3-hydroxymyristoyl) glucosamine N-acyltransferase [Azospirillum brasilense]MDW7552571.1 UDP-3-O-(3-hydroxymyristoyl)glucosamine N-acyltransferase [Azospirillum brasilense]MDW7592237.1 UDP-3-O-(3-hydroxymyristoyl)glucosamine N-acyltransferase [Azospirillum brasilense]MDW7627368.1 UDP-3-O-(3-hydroxymyristoyl)glucosamine N-acyltransferase [Azospirillum brasilense]MDX5954943.1 UDP-3-O-(3-hy
MTPVSPAAPVTLAEIAAALGAVLEGDGTLQISRAVHPSEAEGPEDLALAMDKGLTELLTNGKAVAAVIAEGAEVPANLKGWIVVKRPRFAMAGLTTVFEKPVHAEPGVHPTAFVAPEAILGAGVSVGPFAYVGPRAVLGEGVIVMPHVTVGAEALIGKDCLLHPGARIGERVVMGERCIIHPNAAVGNDGFSFVTPEPGSVESAKATGKVVGTNVLIHRVNSIGTVILGDDVEVGANATIDRGTITATRIGSGTKIDNLVQIGHNVQIGTNCMLCGHVGIAGSTTIGDRVVLAGKVGVADHVKIGNDAVVAANSGVGTDIPAKAVYMGYPAVPRDRAFDQYKGLARLKRMHADVTDLKKRVGALDGGGKPAVEEK